MIPDVGLRSGHRPSIANGVGVVLRNSVGTRFVVCATNGLYKILDACEEYSKRVPMAMEIWSIVSVAQPI